MTPLIQTVRNMHMYIYEETVMTLSPEFDCEVFRQCLLDAQGISLSRTPTVHAWFKISLQVPQILNMAFIQKPLKWGHLYIKDTLDVPNDVLIIEVPLYLLRLSVEFVRLEKFT